MSLDAPLTGRPLLSLAREGGAAACVRILEQLGAEVRAHPRDVPVCLDDAPARPVLVVTDLQPDAARAVGLDLRSPPPGTVIVSVTPFGLDGPDTARSDPGPILGACRPEIVAALAGAHAAVAGLAALRRTSIGGRGVGVEVAAVEVVASCLGDRLARVSCPARDTSDTGAGGRDRSLAVLPCADGYVGIAAPSPDDRLLLAGLTGRAELAEPPTGNGPDWAAPLEPWLRSRTRAEVFAAAQLWRVPVVPVLAPDEVRRDEQSRARGVWSHDIGSAASARSPFRFSPAPAAAACAARPSPLPLSDLRVLDLGMVWSGPYCGRLLAGLGAQVVKVEGPTRRIGTRPTTDGGCRGIFADLNCGKRSCVLDLATPDGRRLFLRLAAEADVVVENFSPRVMPNFGLAYPELARLNPGLVMLSMPAFGSDGPWANYVAYGSGLELATGLAVREGGRPAPAAVPYLDYLAGSYGAAGLLAALLAREASGRGAHVELAQREVACQLLGASAERSAPGPPTTDPAVVAGDRHLVARGLLARSNGRRSCRHYARLPFRLHGVPSRPERPAPGFGSDSRAVLRRWAGIGAAEIEALAAAGVVGGPPRSYGARR